MNGRGIIPVIINGNPEHFFFFRYTVLLQDVEDIMYCCMRGYLQKYLHKFHESEIKSVNKTKKLKLCTIVFEI